MLKEDVIEFFDRYASTWDENMIRNDNIINAILDNAFVNEGKDVLDVACGTGVLIPDYLARNVNSITAVDISPNMIAIAKEKFPQENVQILCEDIETVKLNQKFDCIVVYNAFPHFADPENLIKVLASHLKPGGTLTVAHGMSREQIDRHHCGAASKISNGLMEASKLAGIFYNYLNVVNTISNDEMYQVVALMPE